MVVSEGDMILNPFDSTCPIPWLISTRLAPITLQLRLAGSPGLTRMGLASNCSMIGYGDANRFKASRPPPKIATNNMIQMATPIGVFQKDFCISQ